MNPAHGQLSGHTTATLGPIVGAPEPSLLILTAVGLTGAAALRRRRAARS